MKKVLLVVALSVLFGGTWALSDTGPPNTGTVKVNTPGMIVTVKLPKPEGAKKAPEVPIPYGKEASLPQGKYEITDVQLYKPDAQRRIWYLHAISDLGKLKTLEVASGQAATVEGGEKLKIKTRIVVTNEKPTTLRVGSAPPPAATPATMQKVVTVYLDYVGLSGEHYGPKALVGQAPIQQRPLIRIRDEEEKVLAEGEYHYGSKGYGGFG